MAATMTIRKSIHPIASLPACLPVVSNEAVQFTVAAECRATGKRNGTGLIFLIQYLQFADRRRSGEGTRVVLGDPWFASAAADFAARHQLRPPDHVARRIVDELEAMLVDRSSL